MKAPFLLVPTLLFAAQNAAQTPSPGGDIGEDTRNTELIEESLEREDRSDSWVDSSHEYIGTKADDLAIYLDRFFGSEIEDLESADSNVRFTTRLEYDGDDGSDVGFRLRGNVHLPRISDKVSLVFDGENDDTDEAGVPDEGDHDRNQVGLQVNASESKRSRFDLTLSASSGLNLKPGVRYRFKDDLADWGRFRYTGRLNYSDRKHFHHQHTVELDYLTGETSLLRLSNKVESGQRSDGIEWQTALSWRYGYSLDAAMAFIVNASGRTEPEIPQFVLDDPTIPAGDLDESSLLTSYGLRANFRNRLYKDWLYVELQPGYSWRKRNHFESRHGVFYGRVNFEILFNRGRDFLSRKSERRATVAGSDQAPPSE